MLVPSCAVRCALYDDILACTGNTPVQQRHLWLTLASASLKKKVLTHVNGLMTLLVTKRQSRFLAEQQGNGLLWRGGAAAGNLHLREGKGKGK